MKKVLLSIQVWMIFLLVGCTMEVQTEIPETKSEISMEQVDAGKEMTVHFLDVGQGDAIFIHSPNGKNMLIDGGKKDAGNSVVTYLRSNGVEKLDYVVATHPDADHIGGLLAVLNSISIRNFVDSGKVHTSQTYEKMLQLIQDKKIPFVVPKKGDTIPLDSNLEIVVLNAGEDSTDNNEASIVLKVKYGNISFLLTGDADVSVEQSMLKEFQLESTILKAGHHGSNTSSSEEFIHAVQPKVTILSYGKDNAYGHPNAEVVARLKDVNSQVYATAEVGNIVVKTNGVDYTVSAEEQPKLENTVKSTPNSQVVISGKDLQEEIVEITNTGDTVANLKGWKLISVEGNQVFNFPAINVDPGKTIYITSGSNAREGQGYIKWTGRQMWRNDGDAARLVNDKGEIVYEVQ